ncbi:hypothetical protein [Nitrosomonas eutropha]|uniref:Lipoprotein n=2 Tax=Nitrosomonas eutropha TaxID=916 RepID=A0ABX5M910_9PROT|nr:hypothetical protein [Nitrosomonas eutropha]ABI60088.1 hypothetical protein Neut_1856 [Nitrosomonas eutropha C91]PXV73811.1 hypothetical protein C8R14_1527 [Nitrosomonas eutropha]SEJ31899.1 hypothetical protein SAMN05216318_1481 [Nitrosomonas eutropha]
MKNPGFFTPTMIRCAMTLFILAALISCKDYRKGDVHPPDQQTLSWEEERAQREQQQVAYLSDAVIKRIVTDREARTPWYSNRLGREWFNTRPLAFNGVPYVLLRAVIEVYPDIWKGQGSLGNLGFGPHPDDYDPESGKCLVPRCAGVTYNQLRRDDLWDRYYTEAPARQWRCVERYKIVKRV